MSDIRYDLCVIGGGINGAGIARDAAGRGLRVLLVEAQDLAGATSSNSSKLIHGGLRYLEYYEFKLVREALKEREVLMASAPHIIWPMDFVLPYGERDRSVRPFWMIRAGLFLYDHLARRKVLKGSRMVDLSSHIYGSALKNDYMRGFVYSDCWVDDARLVVLNAMDARDKGADVRTRTACVKLDQRGDGWVVSLRDMDSGLVRDIQAGMVVNAAGPWVRGVLENSGLADDAAVPNVRLVKGSHIVVKRRYEGDQTYILQQPDGRVVFAIPYEGAFTLIGTTEEGVTGDPGLVKISDAEVDYICHAYNFAFNDPIASRDIVWSYSGVRPLFDDGGVDASAVTREYYIHDHQEFAAPMVSVFGGKITTYRVLAEEVVAVLARKIGRDLKPWTAGAILPGACPYDFAQQKNKYQWLDRDLLNRYLRSYGTLMDEFLRDFTCVEDLGVDYGEGVYEAEIAYLIQREWVRSLEDILLRRSKLALHLSEKTLKKLDAAFPLLLEKYSERGCKR